MKISKVRAYPLTVLFKDIFGGAEKVPPNLLAPAATHMVYPRFGQFTALVEITTDDGYVGYGEAYGLPDSRFPADVVNDLIAQMLIGKNPLDSRVIFDSLMSLPLLGGQSRGFVMAAISGIDQALWDIKGKYFNVPVHTLLGGKRTQAVECYASPIMYQENTEETKRQAAEFIQQGFSSVKLKVGRGIDVDIAHIAATRHAIGSSPKLLLDVNSAYDPMTAVLLAKEAEQYGIYWLEEPIPSENTDGYRFIRRRVNMYVATGENECSLNSFRDLIEHEAVDFIMPNLARAGGITGVMDIAVLAQAHSVRVSPHGVGSGVNLGASIQLLSSIKNGGIYEFNQLLNPLRTELGGDIHFENEKLTVPDLPGLGLNIRSQVVEKYNVEKK